MSSRWDGGYAHIQAQDSQHLVRHNAVPLTLQCSGPHKGIHGRIRLDMIMLFLQQQLLQLACRQTLLLKPSKRWSYPLLAQICRETSQPRAPPLH